MAPYDHSRPDVVQDLATALIASSTHPVLLLGGDMTVIAASASFFHAFGILPRAVVARPVFAIGDGEWEVPQLRSLLTATISAYSDIDAYEMDLVRSGEPDRRLVLNARKLEYGGDLRVLLSISDVTQERILQKHKDDLLREKDILLREMQHRVANSLQIICSVLLQSARKVQSQESRSHLHDAYGRVMSIAEVQNQLAMSRLGSVELRPYLTQLCESLGASMIQDRERLKLEVTVDDSAVDGEISVSLGLIVTELVINALKHAFPGRRTGVIKVGYRSQGDAWTLMVSDNGVGMREASSVDQASPGMLRPSSASKAGLGTSILEALARQLQARIHVIDGKPGTLVTVAHTKVPAFAGGGNFLPIIRPV